MGGALRSRVRRKRPADRRAAVGVILLALFGVIALLRIPVQLTPDVSEPVVNVTTIWPGASSAWEPAPLVK